MPGPICFRSTSTTGRPLPSSAPALPHFTTARDPMQQTEAMPVQNETTARMIAELQSAGLRLADPRAGAASRRGGAGPSDHKAVTVDGHTIMVPVHPSSAWPSPFVAEAPDRHG